MDVSQIMKNKTMILYYPAIALVGMYLNEKNHIEETSVFPCSLQHNLQQQRYRKQSKHPSRNKWVKKNTHIHIYTMGYYLAIKRKKLPFAMTQMDFESIMLRKISQREKTKHLRSRLYVESKKNSSQKQRTDWWLPAVRGGEMDESGQKV